jgi:HSP20 family protein
MALKEMILRNRRNSNDLARVDNFGPFGSFHKEVNRLFDSFFDDFNFAPSSFFKADGLSNFKPKVNISEDKKSIEVTAELPGMDEKDIKVTLTDQVLTIEGEKKKEDKESSKEYYRIERSFGGFKRSIRIPEDIKAEAIKANFKNGVLNVSLPKSEKAQENIRQIEVQSD